MDADSLAPRARSASSAAERGFDAMRSTDTRRHGAADMLCVAVVVSTASSAVNLLLPPGLPGPLSVTVGLAIALAFVAFDAVLGGDHRVGAAPEHPNHPVG